jgi:formylglycine-generating enzyme required for sulfatase activity
VGWNATNPSPAFANGTTHPVGQLKPNGLGIHDMSGSVWEWCWESENSGSTRMFRGGGWSNDAATGWHRAAARLSYAPSVYSYILGIRVVLP